jgi:tripartite-type tricarboxylate transporter receptor subunit TctC
MKDEGGRMTRGLRVFLHPSSLILHPLPILAALLAGAATSAVAQTYPSRPVRLIVPQTPGSSTDIIARLVAQRLGERLGQTFVVDNRAGAGSLIGIELVARAVPDGYTLLVVASSITIHPVLHEKLSFDTIRDFAPITQVATYPSILVLNPNVPARSVTELIQLARAKPGQLNVGSSGVGTGTHLSAELFRSMTGVKWTYIQFRGGAPAITALLGGEVQLSFATMPLVLPHARSGRLRALGVTSSRRSPAAPDLPTIAESGVPGYDHGAWNAMLAPAGTPRAIVQKLNQEVRAVLALADVRERLLAEGAEPLSSTPEEFGSIMRAEMVKWAKVIKQTGMKAE